MLSAVGHGACAAGHRGIDWRSTAESALADALRNKYPNVERWLLESRISERQRERLMDIELESISPMQLGARSAVRLEWLADGKRSRTIVWFSTQGVQKVLVASGDLAAGAALQTSDASVAERDVMPLACRPAVAVEELSGTRTRVPLHGGDVICLESIEPRPAVARGEKVTVQFSAGRVAVTSKAIAQADGAIGAVLKVRNPSSGLSYLAEVIGDREVLAHE
ncbi:MAG: flagellar basal body P-ring formation chaperone FlgA [Steroidobacteraceae bacterium]